LGLRDQMDRREQRGRRDCLDCQGKMDHQEEQVRLVFPG